jgi:hypothetical protein
MANKFQVEIQETVEELEHRLERAITAVSQRKINQKTARTRGGDKLWQITAMARKRMRD